MNSQFRLPPDHVTEDPVEHDTLPINEAEQGGDQAAQPLSIGDNLDLLWNDFDYSSLVMSQSFPLNDVALMQAGLSVPGQVSYGNPNEAYENQHMFAGQECGEQGIMSRFESRLPSVEPAYQTQNDAAASGNNNHEAEVRNERLNEHLPAQTTLVRRPAVPWRISKQDYGLIHAVMVSYATILPHDFVLPSRHALCRYVEGFFSGFHEHLPVIHVATFSLVTEAPELILAILSVGARYRFQHRQSHSLYVAAQLLLKYQIEQRVSPGTSSGEGPVWTTPGMLSQHSNPVPQKQHHGKGQGSEASPVNDLHGAARPLPRMLDPSRATTSPDRDLQTMHAMILMIALGTWNDRSLLKDAFSMASHLALLLREHAMHPDANGTDLAWPEWVAAEGRRRAMIVGFCFLNLHSIAYSASPKVLAKDMGLLFLPSPESHWRAPNDAAWREARRRDVHSCCLLRDAYAGLHAAQTDRPSRHELSSFGNYVLIHCIVQDIFFTRQVYFIGGTTSSIASGALSHLDRALRSWQHGWEATKDSSFDPSAPGGPLSFNATALFRLAYSRLHTNMGAHLLLDARDPSTIASAFRNAMAIERSLCVASSVGRAVLQCAHSLSIPVRIGIEFVARTQTLSWSIIHSLCNLECGLFVSKWLQTMAWAVRDGEALREDERRLLGIISAIVSETELASAVQSEADEVGRLLRLSAAVLRLWAHTFQGAHVFDIMGPIGAGLDRCAELVVQDLNPARGLASQ
ncbi:unnamed protein product [Clonostachys rhizophaga]|uniref:Xylanolytic transcriptional activator regulatory domain-containing protein n=1 Tax=Clonostachys rhizophaga TaxID=160324 RepID=A0A9N9VUQ8_9HYPO|nr:unnamed protein product [Clonostachys rhizophaga]